MYPEDLRYTAEHEWIRLDGTVGTIGITSFAQDQLGDVVYVELPRSGDPVAQFKVFGVIDSVKASSDLYAPVTGTVIAVNEALATSPQLVNEQPYGNGWLLRVELANTAEYDGLLTAEQYQTHIATQAH